MYLKLLTTIILFFLSFQSAFSNETILPIKKPDLNEKNTTKKIAEIIPLPKPSEKEDEIQKEIKITTTEIFKKIDGVIIPKNKPLIVKEKLRKIKKQKFYSDRDLKYAKQAISFMEKSNWKDAKKAAGTSYLVAATVTPVALISHLILSRNLLTIVDDAGIIGMILVPILVFASAYYGAKYAIKYLPKQIVSYVFLFVVSISLFRYLFDLMSRI